MIDLLQKTLGIGAPLTNPQKHKQRFKIVFADPPYNQGVEYADDPSRDFIPHRDYLQWVNRVVLELNQYLHPNGTFWWLAPSSHMDFLPGILSQIIGTCRYRIVKQETFAQYNARGLTNDYRILFCFTKHNNPQLLTFNPDAIRIRSERLNYDDWRANPNGKIPGQIWNIRRLQGTSLDRCDWHPCQLPPELLERIVLGWSNPGDSILDAFAGSGNMGRVCKALGRDCLLIDQSETYINKLKLEFSQELSTT